MQTMQDRWALNKKLNAINDACGTRGFSGTLIQHAYEFYLPGKNSASSETSSPAALLLVLPSCDVTVLTHAYRPYSRPAGRYSATSPLTMAQAQEYADRLRAAALLLL